MALFAPGAAPPKATRDGARKPGFRPGPWRSDELPDRSRKTDVFREHFHDLLHRVKTIVPRHGQAGSAPKDLSSARRRAAPTALAAGRRLSNRQGPGAAGERR